MRNFDGSDTEISTYSETFINTRKKKIFCKYWEPNQSPRALVFIAHGFAEHCLPYDTLARTIASNGFFVFSHDHVGHGQSDGSPVHIDSFDHYVQDIFQHVDMIENKFSGLPVFLCGHSMGGAISILSALEGSKEFKGVVLVAPAIATNPEVVTPFKITISRILRWLLPHFPVGALDYKKACSCPKGVKMMLEDPLRWHGFCKAGFGACLVDACQKIQEETSSVTFPFLLLQGEEDKLCDPAAALRFYENVASKDKVLKMYPKAYHALLLEPNGIAEEVIKDIVEWVTAHA